MQKLLFKAIVILSLALSSCSAPESAITSTSTPKSYPINTSAILPATLTSTTTPTLTSTPIHLMQVEYYRLRFEYTVTSDWATLEILNPNIIAVAKLVDIIGNPQDATISSNIINLYRPISAISENPSAKILFDLIILPSDAEGSIQILSKHGALNGSGIKIWNIAEDGDEVLIQEINHFWVDQKNQDTSAWKVNIDLSPLAQYQPLSSRIPKYELNPKMAWAFYYGWYMPIYSWMWWNNPKWTDRPVDEYDSSDPKIIRQQIDQAKSAGLDGFIYATPSLADQALMDNFNTILDSAYQADFKIMALIDLLLLDNGDNLKFTVERNLKAFFQQQFKHPAYMKIDGKPVILVYANNKLPSQSWVDILESIKEDGYLGIYIAEAEYAIYQMDIFDSFYHYAPPADRDGILNQYKSLKNMVLNLNLLRETPTSANFWIATVSPGMDNTPIVRDDATPFYGEIPYIIERQDGDYYRNTWEASTNLSPNWIFITSWNEWQENSCIEPSQMFGDYYLQLTSEYITKWKSK